VLGALDFGANALTHHVTSSSIKGGAVVEFLEQIARQGDERPTVVVLDNASIHHAIETIDDEVRSLLGGYGTKFQINFT
jgi:hypothetical protein